MFGAISSTLAGNYSWPGSLAGIRIGLDLLAEVSALIVSSGRSANRFPAAGNGPRLGHLLGQPPARSAAGLRQRHWASLEVKTFEKRVSANLQDQMQAVGIITVTINRVSKPK